MRWSRPGMTRRGLFAAAAAAGRGKAEPRPRSTSGPKRWGSRCGPRDPARRGRAGPFRALDADSAVVAAYGLILPKPILAAPSGLLQHPRFAPAALARRGADPARDPRGRRGHRRDHHGHGGRARHRADAAQARSNRRQERRASDRRIGERGAALIEWLDPARPSPQPADGVTYAPRSTRPRHGSTGRSRAEQSTPGPRLQPGAGRLFEAKASASAARGRSGTHARASRDGPRRRLLIGCGRDALRPLRPARGTRRDDARRSAARLSHPKGTMLRDPLAADDRI